MRFMKVDKELLEKYYELWLTGAKTDAIKKGLGLTDKKYKELEPAFLEHSRHKIKFDTKVKLINGEPPNLVELTPERRQTFLEYVSTGLSFAEAADMMCVPLITVFDYWFKNDSMLQAEARHAVEILNTQITLSLARRALGGYKTKTETVTEVEGTDKNGMPMNSITTSTTTKIVAGDVNAQKFWLLNKAADKFSADGEMNKTSNKGKILEALDELVDADNSDMAELDARYGDEEVK